MNYWFKPFYQCPISIAKVLKSLCPLLKKSEDGVGGVTGSECVGKRILG